MTRNLKIRPQAELDVTDAALCDQRSGLGSELLDEVDAVLQRVVQSPFQFPEIKSDVRRAVLRRFPYSVYFQVSDEMVDVIAVLHQQRDPRTWQQRISSE